MKIMSLSLLVLTFSLNVQAEVVTAECSALELGKHDLAVMEEMGENHPEYSAIDLEDPEWRKNQRAKISLDTESLKLTVLTKDLRYNSKDEWLEVTGYSVKSPYLSMDGEKPSVRYSLVNFRTSGAFHEYDPSESPVTREVHNLVVNGKKVESLRISTDYGKPSYRNGSRSWQNSDHQFYLEFECK